MKVVICPDSFKESATALDASFAIKKGFEKVYPNTEFEIIPLADGGEGTSEVLTNSLNGEFRYVDVIGPMYKKTNAKYGLIKKDNIAILEVAEAVGLHLIKKEERNPMHATSYGVGEMILDAINNGVKNIVIGLGGSSTNDCGVGMLYALGAKFYDSNNKEIEVNDYILNKISNVNLDEVYNKLNNVTFEVACDVKNPLIGLNGATKIYGRQKGATDDMIDLLEDGMTNFYNIIKSKLNIDLNIESAGAAGGLGAAFLLLKAKMLPGIDLVLNYTNFEERIKNANYIFTGEGAIDHQTAFGKTISSVAKLGKKNNIPVIVLAGKVADDLDNLYDIGVTSIFGIVDGVKSLEQALKDGVKSIEKTTYNIAKIIKK